MSKKEDRIKVLITAGIKDKWYKKGEIHEVGNYLSFSWGDDEPHFEQGDRVFGIPLSSCKVLPKDYIKEYTMDELIELVGHDFKLKTKQYERGIRGYRKNIIRKLQR